VGVDSGQFQREELKRDQFDLFQIEFSCCYLAVRLIAVKDWAKTPSDHVDPYHLGIRFVGFFMAVLAEIYLLNLICCEDFAAGGYLSKHRFCLRHCALLRLKIY
jgi:hypothetical protein